MSVVLSIYSQSAYKEFVLPAIHNAETTLTIDKNLFRLQENIELCLEEMNREWKILESSAYRIAGNQNGEEGCPLLNLANYRIESKCGEMLSAIVQFKETSFVNYEKYELKEAGEILVGSGENVDIYYSYRYEEQQYISKKHAVLRQDATGTVLQDLSKNGVFVNDIRVQGSQKLNFGDRIHIWGMDMVFLGTLLAVRNEEQVFVKTDKLCSWNGEAEPVKEEIPEPFEREIYHRAPRTMEVIEKDPIEIEAPPPPKEPGDMPLLMMIGPAMTMTIPMMLSSVLAIFGARATGTQASLFMYTGIITSISSAMIGVIWALNNVRYNKNKIKKEENHRFEAYSEYLLKKTDEIKEKYEHNIKALLKIYPSAEECMGWEKREGSLWNRNRSHGDMLSYRLGTGDLEFPAPIQIPKEKFTLINDSLSDKPKMIQESYQTMHHVPICVDLFEETVIGIVGGEDKAGAYGVAYDLIAQITTQNCYTDVKTAFVFREDQGERESKWSFAKWMPHTWSADRKFRYVAANANEASDVFYELAKVLRYRSEEAGGYSAQKKIWKPHFILFVEDQSLLEGEPIAKYLFQKDASLGISVILMAEQYEDLPNSCEYVIENDEKFRGIYDMRSGEKTEISFDAMNEEALENLARRLSNIAVQEIEVGGDIPNSISFFDMYGASSLKDFHVQERWKKNRTYENMRSLVGQKAGGAPCYLDIHEKYHGPHGLVAGTTGSGKSETLQTYMLSLALNFSPDDIGFFIIDYKGGGMANLFNKLPHMLGQISNLSGNQVRRAMVSIKSENRRRQRIFNENGVNNINSYTMLYKNGETKVPIPHLFIIIDEFAELKREEGDFMKELVSVAQVGRSLGVHLILATQKPSGTVDDNIWSNSKFRLCLRVQDRKDSTDMLHKPDAAYLTQAGRCYLQVGNDEIYELFQSGWSGAVYEESSENSKKVLAVMLADTGKAALIGGHSKRKQNERKKLAWIERLCSYIEEGITEWNFDSEGYKSLGESQDVFLANTMFEMLKEDGLDFSDNEFNKRAIQNFVQLYLEIAEQEGQEQIAGKIETLSRQRGLKLPELKEKTQLDAVVEYLAKVAREEGYSKPQQLWLPLLPTELYLDELEGYRDDLFDGTVWPEYPEKWELKTVIGLVDDPENQSQKPLQINFSKHGHYAVCGITMSGKSVFLQTVVYSLIHKYSPEYLNIYGLDFSGRALAPFEGEPHVGGILYESDLDTIGKFFHMVENMIKERKQLFRGGNYSQYVMTHGVTCPVVLIVIDNIAGFREKTENQYDEILDSLIREMATYGIYLLISAAGRGMKEMSRQMDENIYNVICMEMSDIYQYSTALNTGMPSTLPEPGIHGRGLAMVDGSPLEFQAAMSVSAGDDYKRNEKIQRECELLGQSWNKKHARQIPRIPEKPVWQEFSQLDRVRELLADDRSLPVGYDMETADIYSVDLSKNYCYLISGGGRSGKTNYMKALMNSAKAKDGELVVVEFGGQELQRTAEELNASYLNSYEAYKNFILEFAGSRDSQFQRRNRIKKECVRLGMEEEEIYGRLHEEKAYYIFIADIVSFTKEMHGAAGTKDNLHGAMSNLFEKGFLHNIYFFACMNQSQRTEVTGREVYDKFVHTKQGIHFGGHLDAQRIFDFSRVKYKEQSEAQKPGIGAVPPTDYEPYRKIVIPLVKGKTVV